MRKLMVILLLLKATLVFSQENALAKAKIGERGSAGGIIYFIDGKRFYECTGLIGKTDFIGARELCEEYRGGGRGRLVYSVFR